jgi:hypothetical protein
MGDIASAINRHERATAERRAAVYADAMPVEELNSLGTNQRREQEIRAGHVLDIAGQSAHMWAIIRNGGNVFSTWSPQPQLGDRACLGLSPPAS